MSGLGGPPPGVSLLDYYSTLQPPRPPGVGPPPGASVLQHYLAMAQQPQQPQFTYETENARLRSRCACFVDPVPEGCSYASSERNKIAIDTFKAGEAKDDLQIFVYLAGHSGMINTHQMPNEPKISVGCNTFFFNNAGESTFTPIGVGSNHTSFQFMKTLGELSSSHDTISKRQFYSFLERFRDNNLITGSPISLYPLQAEIDDLIVLGAGTLYDSDYDHYPDGSRILNRNPASVRIFVRGNKNDSFIGDLISHNLIDMWHHTKYNLQITSSQEHPGYWEIKINPYMYYDQSSGYRPVRLSDIYNFIRESVARMYGITDKHIMDEFMSRHVVLVSSGCRCLGTGDVCRVESVPRPDDPTLQLPDDDTRSVGGGRKKKRRRFRTRKHKQKDYKKSEKNKKKRLRWL